MTCAACWPLPPARAAAWGRTAVCTSAGRQNFDFLLTHPVARRHRSGIRRGIAALRPSMRVGLRTGDEAPYRLPVAPERQASVQETLAGAGVGRRYAILHARPSEESRQWQPERFATVADYLLREYDLDVLLTGTPRDSDYNADLQARAARPSASSTPPVCSRCRKLPALFAGADLMVSVDTGPMHVAALVGTPLVILFHPALARLHHPYGQQDGVITPSEALERDVTNRVLDNGILSSIQAADVIEMVDRSSAAASPSASLGAWRRTRRPAPIGLPCTPGRMKGPRISPRPREPGTQRSPRHFQCRGVSTPPPKSPAAACRTRPA